MRIRALLGLMMVCALAACGDSDSDSDKDDSADAGTGDDVDAGKLPRIKDDELDDCDKGDPCCINSDQYDFARCQPVREAGVEMDAGN